MVGGMCRNIRTLSHFEPPATSEEVRAAARQYVRKVSGTTSATNAAAVDQAVHAVARVTQDLLDALEFSSPPRDRDVEAAKAKQRSAERFGSRAASGAVSA